MNRANGATHHPFARSGLGALSDFKSPEWRELYSLLDAAERRFVELDAAFRSREYRWPRRSLPNWSRCWEYPYVYYHLKELRRRRAAADILRVVDVGSGVTFFPFAMSALGYQVSCIDADPVCQFDLQRATQVLGLPPKWVCALTADARCLPLGDAEMDAVVCISVLEHMDDYRTALREMARVLKPEGTLLLTVDVDMRGDHAMGVEAFKELLVELGRHFDYTCAPVPTHPADLLTSSNGPYALPVPRGLEKAWFLIKQTLIKPLLGRTPGHLLAFDLAVAAFALVRRAEEAN